MKFYADLHIHSRFAIACSKRITLPKIYKWAQLKGITVISTADFTHPVWNKEIKKYLKENNTGLLELKKEYSKKVDKKIPKSCRSNVRFILSTEISLIYKRNNRVRKVHILILAPDLKTVDTINAKLANIGNIESDGRPILGFDSKDLLDMVLNINEECMVIPAHIWTPWFSMFGDKSGFDSVKECFEDLSKYIYAFETGLSSDPEMNWMVKDLDKLTIISNSDAHSLEKIAREANIFNCDLSYSDITKTIKENNENLLGTIEFFPQEGMYHHDGHRKCNINWSPNRSIKTNEICPVCKKRLTIGVLNRVYKMATREFGQKSPNAKSFHYVIPLKEVLSKILEKGVKTKTVEKEYYKVINKFGNELSIALDTPIELLNSHSSLLATAIQRIRNKEVQIIPGYDGVYGEISIFSKSEKDKLKNQKQMKFI